MSLSFIEKTTEHIDPSWKAAVDLYLKELIDFGKIEREYIDPDKNIYPNSKSIFRALTLPINQVKVIMLGQDPYHGEGQADGLAFSTKLIKRPPSLDIIFRELKRDTNTHRVLEKKKKNLNPNNLTDWHRQGVMLLNTVLTVEKGKPNSHEEYGWQIITRSILFELISRKNPKVFVTWGKKAQHCLDMLLEVEVVKNFWKKHKHLNLRAPHPAADSYNTNVDRPKFTGCGHFSEINAFLRHHYNTEIQW